MTWPSVAPLELDVRLRGRGRIPESPMRGRVSCHGSTILLSQITRKSAAIRGDLQRRGLLPRLARDREERQHLEARIRGKEGRYAGGVVRRRDLDAVETAEIQAREGTDIRQGFPARGAADLWRAGPRGKGRVDEVDIEGQEAGGVAHALANARGEAVLAERSQLFVVQCIEAELCRKRRVTLRRQGSPHARLHRARWVDEALFRSAPPHASVEELLAEVFVPHVVVCIELHECKRTVDGSKRTELGEENRVVAAKAQRDHTSRSDLGQLTCGPFDRVRSRPWDGGHVAVVNER